MSPRPRGPAPRPAKGGCGLTTSARGPERGPQDPRCLMVFSPSLSPTSPQCRFLSGRMLSDLHDLDDEGCPSLLHSGIPIEEPAHASAVHSLPLTLRPANSTASNVPGATQYSLFWLTLEQCGGGAINNLHKAFDSPQTLLSLGICGELVPEHHVDSKPADAQVPSAKGAD